MNIIFLCGSLEPGKDGVGDYTRRLAEELVRNGHQAAMIALNDQHAVDEFDNYQKSGGISIPTLRLSRNIPFAKRFKRAGSWIDARNPEWLSLQYVPFAFHPKGLARGLGKSLSILGVGRHWHIMAHELWVGMDKESPAKFVFWGWIQKQLIKSLFTKLKPAVLHTQTTLYMKLLGKLGFKPRHLALFGNIPVALIPADKLRVNQTDQRISFVVFGGIHAGAQIGPLAEELKEYRKNKQVDFSLKMVGRCGSEQARWQQEWERAGLAVEIFGEQDAISVSRIFNNTTFGISSTPSSLIEKSGSVAAMLEHGLPILCIARPWHPREVPEQVLPEGIIQYQQGNIQSLVGVPKRPFLANRIVDITHQFITNLSTEHGKL